MRHKHRGIPLWTEPDSTHCYHGEKFIFYLHLVKVIGIVIEIGIGIGIACSVQASGNV